MSKCVLLDGESLTADAVELVAQGKARIEIAETTRAVMERSRRIVERYLQEGIPAYGLNTGLGMRVNEPLRAEQLEQFSYRMVRGRAQGLGQALPVEAVRAVVTVRLNTLLSGAAGQSLWIADYIAEVLNRGLAPVMPRTASIGAADLVAMAAMPHALIGEGEMFFQGKRLRAAEALRLAGLEPVKLGPKDGQVLCNNTAFTTGQAALALPRIRRALKAHEVAGALVLEGFRANSSPLHEEVAALRPQPGQLEAAAQFRRLLSGGLLLEKGAARRLQDPLSLRCMAQVFGVAHQALERFGQTIALELNSSSDNPAVVLSRNEIVTTGNFHQLQLAVDADQLARALAWCATDSISRVARLMSSSFSGLPPLLSSEASERAGFGPLMKPAEALRAEIMLLATPVAILPSHNADGQEDSLSHAPLAVQKLAELAERYELTVAFELMAGAQAVDLAAPHKIAPKLAKAQRAIRAISRFIDEDRPVGREIEAIADQLVRSGKLAQL
jgi:histidine ammonia-lyase